MFGIEPYQFISFLRQLGLAIAGAASLWGMVFLYLASKRTANDPSGVVLAWIGLRLQLLLYGGGILALGAWTIMVSIIPASAHEGITLISTKAQILAAAQTMTPVYALFAVFLVLGLFVKNFKLKTTHGGISWFYAFSFLLVFVAISYYTDWRGLPMEKIVFHAFHGFHSIFTLGTVLTLDFMFISSRSSVILQQHIFSLFPKISKVIWIGLSLDLLSVLLIFPDAVILSPRLFFAQTVVGILIINGVLLSGVITRRILSLLEAGKHEQSKAWMLFANVAGIISVSSWMSIYMVDFFPQLTLTYGELLAVYGGIIAVLFILHELWERFDRPDIPLPSES